MFRLVILMLLDWLDKALNEMTQQDSIVDTFIYVENNGARVCVSSCLSEGTVVNCFIVLYYKKVKRKVLISLKLDAFASFF